MPDETPLLIDDDRYSRLRLIAWWDQPRLAEARVLVVGAEALGNEVLKNLALLGIGHIELIDFDCIENSNLTRSVLFRESDCGRPKAEVAAKAIRDLNPDVRIRAHHGNVITDIGLGLVREMDVVIGCLDNREARLWVNRMCWKAKTPWIDGGIQEINGVTKVFVPPDGPCYECGMTENDYQLINLRYSCPLLKHDDIQAGKVPTAPTISSIIAGLQTQEALKLLHGMPVNEGAALVFNGISNTCYTTRYPYREDCLSHETYPAATPLPLAADRHSAEALFAAARDELGDGPLELRLDRDLVAELECRPCRRHVPVTQSMYELAVHQAYCDQCGELMKPHLVHAIEPGTELASRNLGDLGIPAYDILQVAAKDKTGYFLLAADRPTSADE